MKLQFNLTLCYVGAILISIFTIISCRKAVQVPSATVIPQVSIQFSAATTDTAARLHVQIYDTNTKHVYYSGTTSNNSYSGKTNIDEGSSVTFVASASVNTNINSQIVNDNQTVAVGTYNVAQGQGLAPSVTLYYKIP